MISHESGFDILFQSCSNYRTSLKNSTDLTKALNLVVDRIEQGHLPSDKPIIIYGSSQLDRADHYFGQIHTLLHFAERIPQIKIYFCQNLSLSRILIQGHHRLDLSTGYEGKIIGNGQNTHTHLNTHVT